MDGSNTNFMDYPRIVYLSDTTAFAEGFFLWLAALFWLSVKAMLLGLAVMLMLLVKAI
ncbi:hypothetical protein IQ249_16430 [Lusitaniella coriacea LEGE 07157]|uniref:Uncharacterized protein n=1 Tax=Lusitaniella coriacea LEGE 07157 TaxID=945747 RepID=A0A8J7DYB3_9CYAN|nr:hypothetical protein [Lusitaniella coriacea]MBE9117488.1 hypothetical protein [Lusitaniella coriacea LEGE 07157]